VPGPGLAPGKTLVESAYAIFNTLRLKADGREFQSQFHWNKVSNEIGSVSRGLSPALALPATTIMEKIRSFPVNACPGPAVHVELGQV
jgi:hypothetical protein